MCRCVSAAVHFVYGVRWQRYLCGATVSVLDRAAVILISLSFHLAWQFMLINNGKYCRDNLCNKERLYSAFTNALYTVESISRLAVPIYNTEDDFPTTNYISRILLLCLWLVVRTYIALWMYLFLYIYVNLCVKYYRRVYGWDESWGSCAYNDECIIEANKPWSD